MIQFQFSAPWGIDTDNLTKQEKEIVVECAKFQNQKSCIRYQSITSFQSMHIKCVQAEEQALKLLELKPSLVSYIFLCAIIYDDYLLFAQLKPSDQIQLLGYKLPFKYQYYKSKCLYFIKKAMKMQPKNPIFLLFRAKLFEKMMQHDLAITIYHKLRHLLHDDKYIEKCKSNKQFMDFNKFEVDFQHGYIFRFFLHTTSTEIDFLSVLNELFPRYVQIMASVSNDRKTDYHYIAATYAKFFSQFGKYQKSYQAFHLQYVKNSDPFVHQHISICLALRKYKEAKKCILDAFHNRPDDLISLTQAHGYFFCTCAEEKSFSCVDDCYKLCKKLIPCDDDNIEQRHRIILRFMICSMLYLFVCCAYQMVYSDVYDHTVLDQIATRSAKLWHQYIVSRFTVKLNNCPYNIQSWYQLECSYLIGMIFRMVHLISIKNKQTKFNQFIMDEKNINSSSKMFQYCLQIQNNYNCEYKFVFLNPCVPLSKYHLGLNALECHQYHFAVKLMKSTRKMTKDIVEITDNYLNVIKECRNKMKEELCVNCKKKCGYLKSCKGCMEAFYCSKRCQKINWKYKHRNVCNKLWLRLDLNSIF
eukprot:331545_1